MTRPKGARDGSDVATVAGCPALVGEPCTAAAVYVVGWDDPVPVDACERAHDWGHGPPVP